LLFLCTVYIVHNIFFNLKFPRFQKCLTKKKCNQVETVGRLVQDRLSHQLDEVEVSIAHQVAQKSQHFFQVKTVFFEFLKSFIFLKLYLLGDDLSRCFNVSTENSGSSCSVFTWKVKERRSRFIKGI